MTTELVNKIAGLIERELDDMPGTRGNYVASWRLAKEILKHIEPEPQPKVIEVRMADVDK